MNDIHPDMRIHHHGIGSPEHDAHGVKVPLEFFQDHQPVPEPVAKHDLQDDHGDQAIVANPVPQLETSRLTLTLPALNSARRVVFLVTGEEKAGVVAEAFGGVAHDPPHPCERVAPINVRREVLLDRAAASKIPQEEADSGKDEAS